MDSDIQFDHQTYQKLFVAAADRIDAGGQTLEVALAEAHAHALVAAHIVHSAIISMGHKPSQELAEQLLKPFYDSMLYTASRSASDQGAGHV